MDMSEAWRIGDDAVSHKRSRPGGVLAASQSIARLVARTPAALDVLGNVSSPLTDISAYNTAKSRHQAWIFDLDSISNVLDDFVTRAHHKRHEL
jgi:hypothetical protein